MIPLSLGEIAAVVGGSVEGDEAVTVALVGNDPAVDWLRGHLAAGNVVLVKASRGARLDEVAAALA